MTDDRREVADDERGLVVRAALAQEGVDALVGIDRVQPFEAGRIGVEGVQRRKLAIEPVQVAHEALHAAMHGIVEQVPVERMVVVPLPLLAELAAHEEQLLAGMRPHEAEIGAQIRELLPAVARHLAEQRALAVHHLVVAQRQHEILGEGVEQAERHLVVMVAAVHGVLAHIFQRVVHPPHVPLVAEAEPAAVDRAGHLRPGGRFLGDRGGAGMVAEDARVHLADEGDRLEVLAPAMHVRDPLAGLAAVVEVEHGGDGVDAERVDVELLQPVERVGDEEVRDLAAAEIVDQRVPVAMEAEARVLVLVKRGAVEADRGRARRWENAPAPSR